ncbi:amine oxidase : Amine oxidase OS=Cystobacter violaceus Cb vi76 GN=Q664_38845 PE=4 SV=1: Amino_oxidase [Gemmataceae bacterium]|nr:amine oxidase : Amine oxidase OS=Cystobacter violaceus Cb vi76 GN=Q664_38845 PE=4 SV=1: Amino_oxidase [Gemmataceae bacterium]VTT96501.1 amine oxidase : Amine oxidase OS=Cystobacter violaceus Cb vi76 GN=Q664_38845 PE=4 SV=1: Amino_oxidase [Gemmataceae bacterium]
MTNEVVIVGAGLAGLCCARELHHRGIRFRLLDAADGVGGRVRTDVVDGFRLDRGFQVFLTSYPEAQKVLDYPALRLTPFRPGALVRAAGAFHTLTDPWRRPVAAVRSLLAPVGSLADKLRVARLRSRALTGSVADRFREPETTTLDALKGNGFSAAMIDRFFRPFLGGIFLEPELSTSSRMFQFVFRMFSVGEACLPAEGMEAIPRQLAAGLPPESIRLGACVEQVRPDAVRLDTGEELGARAVVVATEGPAAARLLGGDAPTAAQGVTCLYFAAPRPPVDQPVLVLNGEGRGPVNNLCVPTAVAPTYGPAGSSLVSATVLGTPPDEDRLRAEVREQLAVWFGSAVDDWRHLRTYRIPYALPRQVPPALAEPERPVRWQPGVYVCGDHRDNASINGSMVSGRRAAEAVAADLA